MTSCALRNGIPPPHQLLGQIGRAQCRIGSARAHPLDVELQRGDEARQHRQRLLRRLDGVVERLLRLLQILVVSERQPLADRQQRDQITDRASRLAAQELGDVGVALLRHERAARAVALAETHEPELGRRPEHQLLAEARQVHGQQRRRKGDLRGEVAIGDGVEAVVRRPAREPQRGGRVRAIDRQPGSRQRARAERRLPRAPFGVDEAPTIAPQHLGVGHQVMAERHHLRALQVRVAGEQRGRVRARLPAERQPRAIDRRHDLDRRAPRVEAQVGRHLIVAAARGVQPPRRLADDLDEAALHVHVDVFQRRIERALAGGDLLGHLVEPVDDGLGVGRRDQLRRGQHPRVGLAAAHVVAQEPAIEVNRRVERRRRRVHRPREARTTPAARLTARHFPLISRSDTGARRVPLPQDAARKNHLRPRVINWRNRSMRANILEGSANDWPTKEEKNA